jgi:hypothetical protein
VHQHAELVAAHPVRDRVAGERAGEPVPEPHEQRVAGRVAEGVVVALEAVEVDEDEPGGCGQSLQRAVEVVEQPAPVAEAGELVGQRVAPRGAEHGAVGGEREREPRHDRGHRGGLQHAGDHAEVQRLVVGADRDGDDRGADREGEHAEAGRVGHRRLPARLPRRDRDQQDRDGVRQVEQAAGRPAALDRLDDIQAVGGGEQHERGAE